MADKSIKVQFKADTTDLTRGINKGEKDLQSFGDQMGKLGKVAGAALAGAAAAAGAFAIKLGVDAVKAASDLGETMSKTNVLFGQATASVVKFADSAAKNLGQSKQQALDAAATFATFGKSAGLAGEDLVKFSTDFVKLSSDLASFNNTTPEQAIQAIGAALRGEAEPLRAYGVLLDDASMRQKALELGIISTTKEALTPQQKVLAAQALIFEQTSAAQGDFERTSEGLANKQRVLAAELENAKAAAGEALLPAVLTLTTAFSDIVPVIGTVASALAEGAGQALQKVADFINESVLPAMSDLWTYLEESVIPQLERLTDPILTELERGWDGLRNVLDLTRQDFDALAPIIRDVNDLIGIDLTGTLGRFIASTIRPLTSQLEALGGGLRYFFAYNVANTIETAVNVAIRAINDLIARWNSIPFLANVDYIREIKIDVPESLRAAPSPGSPAALAAAQAAMRPNYGNLTVPATRPSGSGGGSGSGSGSGGGSGSGSRTTAAQAAAEEKARQDRIDTIESIVPNLERILADLEKSQRELNLTVNVQGALIDPEGAARAIEQVMLDSTYRTGTRVNSLQAVAV